MLFSATIREIQYTTDAGFDGTYPSLYLNQQVSIEGVVIAKDFQNDRFIISDQDGGPWSSVCVSGHGTQVEKGQLLAIEGKVLEIHGMTVIRMQKISVLSHNSIIPQAYPVTLYELNNNESFESVLVKVSNVTLAKSAKPDFPYSISNNALTSYIGNGFNCLKSINRKFPNRSLNCISGIISFSNNRFSLNPRDNDDFVYQTTSTQASSWGKIKSLYR